MASNVSTSAGHELTIDDLRDVYTALITLASKFRYIGLELDVPPHTLNEIDINKYDCKEKLYNVLEYRLNQRIPLTWEDIGRALRSPAVDEQGQARQIEYEYLPHSSSQSVPTPVPPVSNTSDRPGPSHQPSHQQQPLHQPSHQPFHPQHSMIQSHHQFPGSCRTEQYMSFVPSQQQLLLQVQHILSSLAPVPLHHQQQYHPHIQQPPSEHVQFPIIQPHCQTPHPRLRHSSVHMQYSSNPLYSTCNDSQQSQSPQQPSSAYTVSIPLTKVSLSHEQILSPAPLTKRPRLEPRASSCQQSVPPLSPTSSTLVASHTPTPQESIQTSSLQHIQSAASPQQPSSAYTVSIPLTEVSLSHERSLSPTPLTKTPRLEPRASSRRESVPPPSHSSSTLVASHTPTPQESFQTSSSSPQHIQSAACPQQPSSAYTVSIPLTEVSLSHEQSLFPTPLTKRPRLEPRASSRQPSLPPPSPASSTLVASHTPTPQESIQTSSLQHVQSAASPPQPFSAYTVSIPLTEVSLSHEQSLSPTPLTKRPRLEPRASSRQQSVPPPSPASSTLVASHTLTPQESIQISSLQHVQSIASSSGVSKTYSKAMTNFTHYIKNIYKSKKVETFVKFALNPTKVYINLALIDRHVVEHKEYKDITMAMVQDGNVDVIQEKKERIELNKIASGIPNPITEGGKVNGKTLILVDGAPGVGKSTFAWEFCRRWLQGIVAPQYDLVLLLRLRDHRIKSAKTLKDLLYIPLPGVSEQVLQEIVMGKYNVLLILEGYDELPDSVRNDSSSVFNELISGELLPLATILVTSRPWATEGIRKHQSRLFQHIEVLGFTKRQVKEYIKATVPADKLNDLTSYLERHPQIRSGMYIPLNSAIVVAVYLASQRGTQPLPKTQTELYTSLVDSVIGRHMESHPELKKSAKIPFLGGISVPIEIHKHLVELSKLAYNGIMESDEEVKLIFSEEELPPNFDNLGFMDSVTDLYLNQETKSSHNFLHLTFQEFFAAAYISAIPLEKQRGYYQENIGKKVGRLNVVLKFLSGLKKLDCFTEENAMLIIEQPLHKPPCEFISPPECMIGIDVVNWMFEAQSEDKISMILGERKIEFKEKKVNMTPMDYYSLGYCISHSQCQWVLSLTGRMAISKEKIRILSESATGSGNGRIVEFGSEVDTNASGAIFISLIREWSHCLNIEVLPSVEFEETALHRILSSTSSLMYLSFKKQWNYEPITEALCNNQLMSLKKLKFEEIELTPLAGHYLVQFLKNTKLLDHFSLIQCVVPAQELLQVFQVVQQNPVIRENEISKCKLLITCDNDFQCISQLLVLNILRENFVQIFKAVFSNESKCVTELVENRKTVDLSNGKLDTLFPGRAGIKYFIKAIFNTTTFNELNISDNEEFLGESCVLVAEALQQNSTLLTLNMSYNDIGNEGAGSLAEALKHNSTLETLNLSDCDIGNDGVVALSQALLHNSSLKILNLENKDIAYLQRKIGVEGAQYLAESLRHNFTLEELNLSNCSIGNDGTIALSHALLQNSTLKVLHLQSNNIDETGISSLGYSLQQNHTLLSLDLSHNSIADKGAHFLAEALKENSTLETLNLSSCDISHIGAGDLSQALLQNSSLKELNLNGNEYYSMLGIQPVGDKGVKHLAEALKHNFTLEILNLSECGISDDGAIALLQALVQNSSLRVLNLMGNSISKRGVVCLSNALEQNSTLLHLDLSYNIKIGVEGATSLAKALYKNSKLEELRWRYCSVSDDGADALSQSLFHNSSLKILDIGGNSISNTGAAAIAEALTQNSTLLHLNLSRNSIGNEGLKSLSEALTRNSTLEELDLSWCGISYEGTMALLVALYKNSSLKVLHFNYNNGIGQEAREALITATNHQSISLSILIDPFY